MDRVQSGFDSLCFVFGAVLTRGIESPRAAHESGAATGIVNVGVTRADDFVSLKINARLGEVPFSLSLKNASLCVCIPIICFAISYRSCPECFIWVPSASLHSNNISSGLCSNYNSFIFINGKSIIIFPNLLLQNGFLHCYVINSKTLNSLPYRKSEN